MYYKKTTIIVSAIIIAAGTIGSAGAWGFRGGAVIDFGRLAKNIADVQQVVQTAQNYVQMVRNMNFWNFGDTLSYLIGDVEKYGNKVEDTIDSAKSAMNAKVSIKRTVDKPLKNIAEVKEKGAIYLQDLRKDEEELVKDCITLTVANSQENSDISESIKKVLNRTDQGVNSELKRKNAIDIATAKIMLNQAYQENANMLNAVQKSQQEIEKKKVEEAQRRAYTLPVYDPFQNEKEIRSNNYGFPRFGK